MTWITKNSSREKRKKKHNKDVERRRKNKEEIERLLANVNPRAKPPLSFPWWSDSFQIMWLRQHQKKETK